MGENKIVLTDADGKELVFYVLEETRVSGVNYLLVTDSEEDGADCFIMKDVSAASDKEAVYEFVEDDETLEAVGGLFKTLMEDVEIQ